MHILNSPSPEQLAATLDQARPETILGHALTHHPRIALSFSGAEDVVLIDMAVRLKPDVAVFSLDTGRLHPETYSYLDRVRVHYGIDLEILFPEAPAIEALTRAKGLYSFRTDGHQECCAIRKVAPLKRKLAALDAWITGQRRDQSPTRAAVPVVQADPTFAAPGRTLLKFNPLANWTSAEVWDYIRARDVPYNPLHERGYVSIGCEPCTRAVLPHQHEREGRWWWEDARDKECGLHANHRRAANG